jgi:hypothetical protein
MLKAVVKEVLTEGSKMATRKRKQLACVPLSKYLVEAVETHLAGKTTKKRQNSDTSTPQPTHRFPIP